MNIGYRIYLNLNRDRGKGSQKVFPPIAAIKNILGLWVISLKCTHLQWGMRFMFRNSSSYPEHFGFQFLWLPCSVAMAHAAAAALSTEEKMAIFEREMGLRSGGSWKSVRPLPNLVSCKSTCSEFVENYSTNSSQYKLYLLVRTQARSTVFSSSKKTILTRLESKGAHL